MSSVLRQVNPSLQSDSLNDISDCPVLMTAAAGEPSDRNERSVLLMMIWNKIIKEVQ